MTTITINERTKAGRTLLELAKILAVNNEGVQISSDVEEIKENELTLKQDSLINKLREVKRDVDNGSFKGQTAQSFLDEL